MPDVVGVEEEVVGFVFEVRAVFEPQPDANAEADIEVTARRVRIARVFFMASSGVRGWFDASFEDGYCSRWANVETMRRGCIH